MASPTSFPPPPPTNSVNKNNFYCPYKLGENFPEVENKGCDSKTALAKKQRHTMKFKLNLTPKILTISNETSVSFKDAEGG